MIEKIITSKTRVKLLILFITNIDNRYYLRELERKLDESLSPLRRQLVKLEKMGILITEKEANLKYYRLNKNFEGMEELRGLVLGAGFSTLRHGGSLEQEKEIVRKDVEVSTLSGAIPSGVAPSGTIPKKRMKHDIVILTTISLFVLAVSAFMIYTTTKNVRQVASLVSEAGFSTPRRGGSLEQYSSSEVKKNKRPDEMISRRWKLLPGNVPVLSSGDTGGGRTSKEL